MPEPWRVSFPVLRDPYSQQDHIVYLCRHIPSANPAMAPTHGYCIGMDRKGEVRKFTVLLHDYYMAEQRALVHFIQVDNIRSPEGVVSDGEAKKLDIVVDPNT